MWKVKAGQTTNGDGVREMIDDKQINFQAQTTTSRKSGTISGLGQSSMVQGLRLPQSYIQFPFIFFRVFIPFLFPTSALSLPHSPHTHIHTHAYSCTHFFFLSLFLLTSLFFFHPSHTMAQFAKLSIFGTVFEVTTR